MKQYFTHRLPSRVTLLSDPWPDDPILARARKEIPPAPPVAVKTLRPARRRAVVSRS